MHYVGVAWSNGKEFDASWNRRSTFDFRLGAGEVIQGWDLGVAGMKVGGRRILNIPYADAFGEEGNADLGLPAKTDLILVVDLFAAF